MNVRIFVIEIVKFAHDKIRKKNIKHFIVINQVSFYVIIKISQK